MCIRDRAYTIDGFTFVWFTDGIGWKSARGNLRETFEVMDTIYSIDDMENGIMDKFLDNRYLNKESYKMINLLLVQLVNTDMSGSVESKTCLLYTSRSRIFISASLE